MASIKERPDPKMSRADLVEELTKLKSLTSGFFGCVPGIFIVLDHKWRIIYLKDDEKKIFIGDLVSLHGMLLTDIIPMNLAHMLSPDMITKLIKEKESTVNRFSGFLGKWFRVSAYSSDFGIFIRLEDVSTEMLTNRLLRLNEFAVNHSADMVLWMKPGGHIIYGNVAACSSLGYDRKGLTKMKIGQIDPVYGGEKWAKLINDIQTTCSMSFESSFRTRDGAFIPVEVNCNYIQYCNEDYLIAYARDITERKRTEESLKEAKAEAELYVDLMGHDINNMNQIATGYLELALDLMKAEGGIDDKHADLVYKPYEMLQNSSRLIENVRKVQREKAGHYETSILDVGHVLREVKDTFANVPGRDIEVKLNLDGQCLTNANVLLKDIFINLVGNSIKHSRGPLAIGIAMAKVEDEGKAYCRVAVEDNGPGIPDDMKTRLLSRTEPENTRARGKGFGLYLIRQLVKDFNGKFRMEDRVPGDHTKGARFIVMLPVAE